MVHQRLIKKKVHKPVNGRKAQTVTVDGIRYYFDRSTRKVMAQGPDSEPYVPHPDDIPKGFGALLESGR